MKPGASIEEETEETGNNLVLDGFMKRIRGIMAVKNNIVSPTGKNKERTTNAQTGGWYSRRNDNSYLEEEMYHYRGICKHKSVMTMLMFSRGRKLNQSKAIIYERLLNEARRVSTCYSVMTSDFSRYF